MTYSHKKTHFEQLNNLKKKNIPSLDSTGEKSISKLQQILINVYSQTCVSSHFY